MADYSPVYAPGTTWTSTTSAQVTGRQVLVASGAGTVAPSGAQSVVVVGVAAMDRPTGEHVTVHSLQGVVHLLTASGSITAGNRVESAAAGAVAQGTTAPIGVALTSAGDGELVEVLGR